ncbi:hypothetical protein GH714_000300 [Hevea brasiliensis]|uniref:Inositol polyphosphate-related phosphatase domain-containing protein n=1 Tax=Hevea brasiliensis TaxID=3981 RepID=A0A6A6KVH5_HEVBR|nr:hypothetical protein GH714_000300 [Hevea brasiliensis]
MDLNDDVLSSYSHHHHDDDSSVRTPKIFDRYFSSSSSSSDDESQLSNSSMEATSKRLDYMIQFLDRKLSCPSNSNYTNNNANSADNDTNNSKRNKSSALSEFIGKGGGTGIFRLPVRGAVHTGRPPSLEVQPHPLRESQIGGSLRTITTTETQLWTGSDNGGVQVWQFKDLYGGCGDSAPYRESVAVGSGEVVSWVAHRGPILSMVITRYGDLWSGSEGGAIKIWPWEAIEKSFSFTEEERHMASLLVERSYIDPRSQVTINGFCNVLTSDIRYLLSDNSRAKVWSAGYLSFALWDAHTRELLKIFNIDGQIERMDMSSAQDFTFEDEIKMKIVAGPKKEKIQSSFGFFQRSRNAIMGAADAVRRVAAKSGFGDDNRRTEALIITVDGMIWTGCANGLLVQWDGNGNRFQDFQYHSFAVQCFCTFGLRIWVGYASGTIQVLDLEGNLLGGSVAGDVGIVVVGLQEVEMGAGVLAMSAAKETWWIDMIDKTLDEGPSFERVGSRQLAGLLIAVWIRNNLKAYVGDVDAAAVPCGFGRAIVNRRNADFDHVYRTMTFGRPSNLFNAAAAGSSSAVQMLRTTNVMGANSSEGMPELSEADMVIFLGDFNYRLGGISYDEARDFISQRCFDWLRERDQLRAEMEAGNVFQGMREAVIRFPPTYKFDKHQPGLAGYDSGEKKRVPAWCDRILYRDSRSTQVSESSLDCPIVSLISQYDACMDVTDSDHKPVRCIFSVDIARVDESVRRQEFGT